MPPPHSVFLLDFYLSCGETISRQKQEEVQASDEGILLMETVTQIRGAKSLDSRAEKILRDHIPPVQRNEIADLITPLCPQGQRAFAILITTVACGVGEEKIPDVVRKIREFSRSTLNKQLDETRGSPEERENLRFVEEAYRHFEVTPPWEHAS